MGKITLEQIQEILDPIKWSVVSTEYKNLGSEMVFKCDEGHSVYSSWGKLRNKIECPVCKQNIFKDMDTKVVPKLHNATRILAIDQATKISGWAIFDNDKLVKYGTFVTNLVDEFDRFHEINQWLISMIQQWKPDIVGLEGIQYQNEKNNSVTTFQSLARLQGVLVETCLNFHIQHEICHTAVWRSHCGVKGRTRQDKKQSMQLIAKEIYDISIENDCADAIGIGKYLAESIYKKPKIVQWI